MSLLSRVGDFPGHSSTRGAEFRGVLASSASADQRGVSAQGAEPEGGSGRDQAVWIRAACRAGDRGGARADRPRWERILVITVGSTMAAIIVKEPPLLKDSVPWPVRRVEGITSDLRRL